MKIDKEKLYRIFFIGNIAGWVLIVIGFLIFILIMLRK